MRDENCIFCKIANGEIPSDTVFEDTAFRVILDLNPASKGHALILPKDHYDDLAAADGETLASVLKVAQKICAGMKKSLNCDGLLEIITKAYPSVKSTHSTKIYLGRAMKALGFECTDCGHIAHYKVIPLKAA